MPITASSNCAFSFVLGPWFTEMIESLAQTGNESLAATKTVDTAGDWIENSFLRSKSHFVLTCWFNAKFGFDRKAKFCEKLVFSVKFKHDLRLEVWEWCWYRVQHEIQSLHLGFQNKPWYNYSSFWKNNLSLNIFCLGSFFILHQNFLNIKVYQKILKI